MKLRRRTPPTHKTYKTLLHGGMSEPGLPTEVHMAFSMMDDYRTAEAWLTQEMIPYGMRDTAGKRIWLEKADLVDDHSRCRAQINGTTYLPGSEHLLRSDCLARVSLGLNHFTRVMIKSQEDGARSALKNSLISVELISARPNENGEGADAETPAAEPHVMRAEMMDAQPLHVWLTTPVSADGEKPAHAGEDGEEERPIPNAGTTDYERHPAILAMFLPPSQVLVPINRRARHCMMWLAKAAIEAAQWPTEAAGDDTTPLHGDKR